jgi:hypothetical protein
MRRKTFQLQARWHIPENKRVKNMARMPTFLVQQLHTTTSRATLRTCYSIA